MEAAKARHDDWRRVVETEAFVDRHNEKVSQSQLIGILNAAEIMPADPTKLFNSRGRKNVYIEFGNPCAGCGTGKGASQATAFC